MTAITGLSTDWTRFPRLPIGWPFRPLASLGRAIVYACTFTATSRDPAIRVVVIAGVFNRVFMPLRAMSLATLVMSSVAHKVSIIFAIGVPPKVVDTVVFGDAVVMTGNHAQWARSDECFEH